MELLQQLWDLLATAILRGGLYALMAVGLSLVFGVMNIANFSHGEFYMIGAYFAYFGLTVFNLGPLPSIVFAGLIAAIIGVIVERGFFKPLRRKSKKGWLMNTFLLTLGISIIMQNTVRMIWGSQYRGVTQYWEGRTSLLTNMEVANDRIVAFCIAMVAITLLWYFLTYTRTGRAIRAVSQDETGSSLMGIDLNWIHTLTFSLSCSLAAIAGASLLSINPAYPTMGVSPLYKSWFVLILVGMGNIWGSIYGGLIVGLLETISIYQFGAGWQDVISLAIIILILLFKPSGLFAKKGVKSVLE
ncbi:MAG: branched-chain amino acid ABC transporter permease [Dethiobacteria bacterium]|nr:branched-chain amino acid ABC transporter permease [Dethiobacteria bacterium]